jgi:coenzyme F420 hydrogenase subunit beta
VNDVQIVGESIIIIVVKNEKDIPCGNNAMGKFQLSDGKDYCVHCGLCIPFCERSANREDSSVCKDCLLCYSVCPRVRRRFFDGTDESPLGSYEKIWKVKSVEKPKGVQDTGFVTILVKHLLKTGRADAVLLTRRDRDWHPEPFLATEVHEAERASGTKFTVSPALSLLKEGTSQFTKLAIVGLPCQLAALQNFLRSEKGSSSKAKVVITIGLFCMNSFIYGGPSSKGMKDVIEHDLGIPIEKVEKMEIRKGKLRIYSSGSVEPVVRNVKEYGDLIWPICLSCVDFTGVISDISVGSVGSEDYTNTVIVRTDKGSGIFKELIKKGFIEAEELEDPSEIKRLAGFKRSRRDKLSPEEKKFLNKQTVRGNFLKGLDRCTR